MSADARDGADDVGGESEIEVPTTRAVDHHDADEFRVRCTDCGVIDRVETRPEAHDVAESHALACSQTGVTPLRHEEEREPENGDRAELVYTSRQTGNPVQVGGTVIGLDDGTLAFNDSTRIRQIRVDLDESEVRSLTAGREMRLGELRSLTVSEPDGVDEPDGRRPRLSDAERERRLAAAEEFEARVAAADGGDGTLDGAEEHGGYVADDGGDR